MSVSAIVSQVPNTGLEAYLYDRRFNSLSDSGPITAIIGATLHLTELDTWSAHSVTFEGTVRRNVAIMQRDVTIVEFREAGTGTVAWGIVYDPDHQITDRGASIVVTMPNVTHMLSWFDTGRGRYYKTGLDAIIADLGHITPYWSATDTDTGGYIQTAAAVDWQYLTGMVANGSSIHKVTDGINLSWLYGAYSVQVASIGDCAFSCVAQDATSFVFFGLSSSRASYSYANIDKAVYLRSDGTFLIQERGVNQCGSNTYKAGDSFTIAVQGTTTVYYHNGVIVWSTSSAISYPLQAQISVATNGGGVSNSMFTWLVPPSQQQYVCRFEQATPLYAFQQLQTDLLKHCRQGRNPDGSPAFTIEFGDLGADHDFWLKSADGSNVDDVRANNSHARIVHTVTHKREASKLVNSGLPLGGGNGTTQPLCDRLWKMLWDPTYPNYGKVGNVPGSAWPEYDANYPLPALPSAGLAGVPPDVLAKYPYFPAKPRPDGTGYDYAATNDGRWDYVMERLDSKAAHGLFVGSLTDGSYTYPTSDAPTQEMVQRALYLASKAKLYISGDVNEYYTVVCDAYGQPVPAGDYINLQWRGGSTDEQGDYTFLDIDTKLKVLRWTRTYSLTGNKDTVIVNASGFKGTTTNQTQQQQKQVQALRLVVDAVTVTLPIGGQVRGIDDTHPVPVPVIVPDNIFQMTSLSLYIDQFSGRSTVKAAGAINENGGLGITGTYAAATGGSPYTGGVISNVNLATYSGGVISSSIYGATATGGVNGTPIAGGYSGYNVTLGRTLSVQNSTNITGGLASTATDTINLRHHHEISVSTGGSDAPLGTSLHFISQAGGGFLQIGWKGPPSANSTGGPLPTNDWVPPSSGDSHAHHLSHGGLDNTHDHNISDYHDLRHYHDISHYHDMAHVHNIDHVHYFPHTHQMVAGIFDTPAESGTFYVYVDGTDVSPYVTDANGTVGPWSGSSVAIPNLLVSSYAAQRFNQKGKHLIEVHVSANTSGQHGYSDIQVAGLATAQISGITTTAFAI